MICEYGTKNHRDLQIPEVRVGYRKRGFFTSLVPPKIGMEFLFSFSISIKITTKYFILCCPWRRKTQSHQASTKDSTYSFHKY